MSDNEFKSMLKQYLIQEEGFQPKAKVLFSGEKFPTIGYGHYGPDVKPGQTITEEEALNLLDKDIDEKTEVAKRTFSNFDQMSPELKVLVTSEVFRGSLTNANSPRTVSLINEGNFDQAADEYINNEEYIEARDNPASGRKGIVSRFQDLTTQLKKEAGTIPPTPEPRPMEEQMVDAMSVTPEPRPTPMMSRSEESPDYTKNPFEDMAENKNMESADYTASPDLSSVEEMSDEEYENLMKKLALELGVTSVEEEGKSSSFQEGGMPQKNTLDRAAEEFFQEDKINPAKMNEGGSVEKEVDFVKDDDEEPADPPPGATPEEVADDIPAYLSTGEYVLPANVVRYLGLERIVEMHKGALQQLQQMEDLDIIENVDENGMVEEDDDEMDYLKEPKGVVKTTLVVAKPHPSGMMAMPFAQGGAPGGPDDTGAASDIGEDTSMEGFDLDTGDKSYGDQGFGSGLDEGGEDEEEDSTTYSSPGFAQSNIDAFPNLPTTPKIEEPSPFRSLVGLMSNVPGVIGLAAGVIGKEMDRDPNAMDELDPPDEGPEGEPDNDGGEPLLNSGIITEEQLDPDKDPSPEFKFIPGIGYRRVVENVRTAKRGGLMDY